MRGPEPTHNAVQRPISMPYAPYGGMLISRRTLCTVGLPDYRLELYEDDTEFSHRITTTGGTILLDPQSTLCDIDANWLQAAEGNTGPDRLVTAESSRRVYYSVRNRVYFERHRYCASVVAYALNKAVYISLLWVIAVRRRARARFRLILRAIRDGEAARFDSVPTEVRL